MISGRTRNFLTLAQVAAGNSTYRHRLGSVITSGGRVRGVGWSKARNIPANVSENHIKECSIHAEIDALRGLKDLKRATCFVVRLDAQNAPTMARPCDTCWTTLLTRGVSRIYWSVDGTTIGTARTERLEGGLGTVVP